MRRAATILLAIGVTLPATGCMRSVRARATEYATDFLDSYERLEPGDRYEPLYQWNATGVDWTAYDKLILAPVVARGRADDDLDVPHDIAEDIIQRLDDKLYIALCPDYLMVNDPCPGALHLEVAVTRIMPRHTLFDTTTTISPIGLATTAGSGAYSGRTPFTGGLAIEYRITEAESGRPLAEAADRRLGGKWIAKGFSKWADANAVIDAYAEMLPFRLCRLRDGDCEAPLQP